MPFPGPEIDVPAPPLAAPPTGLLQACQVVEPGDDRWINGIRWSPENALPAELVDPCTDAGRVLATMRAGRVVTDAVTNTDSSLVSLTANFTAADVGAAISAGGDIPASTFIKTVTNAYTVVLTKNTTGTHTAQTVIIGAQAAPYGGSRKAVVVGQPFLLVIHDACSSWGWAQDEYIQRALRGLAPKESWGIEHELKNGTLMGASRKPNGANADGHLTNGSAAISSATADFSQDDVGKVITSDVSGIPAGTTILTVTSATAATMSANFTGTTSTAATFTIASLAAGSNRWLNDDNVHVYTTGSVDPTPAQALAYANEAIAKANIGQGMIHMSAFMLEAAVQNGYVFEKDARGRLVTPNGNIIVAGNGYNGVGPDGTGGTADDSTNDSGHTHEWIHVTDLIQVMRAPTAEIFPKTLAEAMNRSQNEVNYRAERPYVIVWSGLLQSAIKCKVPS